LVVVVIAKTFIFSLEKKRKRRKRKRGKKRGKKEGGDWYMFIRSYDSQTLCIISEIC